MPVRREYRDRAEEEVAILDALSDRHEVGMTLFELRSRAEVDIETLETALNNLRDDGLITVDEVDDRPVIRPDERVLPSSTSDHLGDGLGTSLLRRVRKLLRR